MKRGFPSFVFTAAVFVFSPFAEPAQTNTIIVPKAQSNSFGSEIGYFFGGGGFAQIYGEPEFAEISHDVIAITGIALRWDESYAGSIDVIAPRVSLNLGTSAYAGGNFDEYVRDVTPVFDETSMRLTAPENRPPSQFDLLFPFHKPFVYDRRKGRLVLEGSVAGISTHVDGEFMFGGGSYFVLPDSTDADRKIFPHVMVSKFFYYPVLPVINSICTATNRVEIKFTIDPGTEAELESAYIALGPFDREESAQITETAPGQIRALVPISGEQRFFRIRTM